ncbi:MAG: hypothetical protein M3P18_02510 [Actinomycetota bacterium]|nr:hypothetical protein [Actinomycetota bacterium]
MTLDTDYVLEPDGADTVLKLSRIAVGAMNEEDAAGIHQYCDVANFEAALRKFLEE